MLPLDNRGGSGYAVCSGGFEWKDKFMIYGSRADNYVNISALLKSELLDEADAAFHENDRLRCMEAINRLYRVFDDECEAY